MTHPTDPPSPAVSPAETYLASLESPESRRTMRGVLDALARMLTDDPDATAAAYPWHQLSYADVVTTKAALIAKGYSPSHVNKHLHGLRRVLRTCWRMQLVTAEDYQRITDVPDVRAVRLRSGRNVHGDELARMLAACEDTTGRVAGPAGTRDAALIAVLYVTGMRRAEAATVQIENYNPGERSIRVIGKRNKARVVYVTPSAVPVLERWLNLLDSRSGPLFRPIDRYGNIGAGPMTPSAVGYRIERARTRAGVPLLSPHDFRRTFCGDLLDSGVDLATVQKLMGHVHASTTAGYDVRGERALRAAADKLTLPSPTSDI